MDVTKDAESVALEPEHGVPKQVTGHRLHDILRELPAVGGGPFPTVGD